MNKVVKTCSLSNIGTRKFLNRFNIVLIDLRCDKSDVSSESCRKDTSFLKFQCKNGFKFANNQGNLILN